MLVLFPKQNVVVSESMIESVSSSIMFPVSLSERFGTVIPISIDISVFLKNGKSLSFMVSTYTLTEDRVKGNEFKARRYNDCLFSINDGKSLQRCVHKFIDSIRYDRSNPSLIGYPIVMKDTEYFRNNKEDVICSIKDHLSNNVHEIARVFIKELIKSQI